MITVPAPAKVNLTLRIRGKRPDGFHQLESVMQWISLEDTLQIDDADPLLFTCSDPSLAGEDNLVMRAARLLQAQCPIPRGAHLRLEKRIPVQAGLGGGSSDAAAALMALNEFWDIRLPFDDLYPLAAQLGSDVPFFLDGAAAIVRGRGEIVTPIIHTAACPIVLAKPGAGLSTPQVYAALQAPPYHPPAHDTLLPETTAMVQALHSGDPQRVAKALVNDLEGPALQLLPALFRLRERMLEEGCLQVLLCGSGSAVLGICADDATAQHVAVDITNDCPWSWAGALVPAVV